MLNSFFPQLFTHDCDFRTILWRSFLTTRQQVLINLSVKPSKTGALSSSISSKAHFISIRLTGLFSLKLFWSVILFGTWSIKLDNAPSMVSSLYILLKCWKVSLFMLAKSAIVEFWTVISLTELNCLLNWAYLWKLAVFLSPNWSHRLRDFCLQYSCSFLQAFMQNGLQLLFFT